jgi:hypothetical protein
MRAIPFSMLGASLLLASCGGATSSSVPTEARGDAPARVLMQTPVSIFDASTATLAEHGPMWTDVALRVQVPCYAKLETLAATAIPREEGRVQIATAAFLSMKKPVPGESVCLSVRLETHHLKVSGNVPLDHIGITNLGGDSAAAVDIPADTEKVATFGNLKVVDVTPLCAPGATCRDGEQGTKVTLQTEAVSCADSVGPVTFVSGTDAATGKLRLAASAIRFVSARQVGCAATPRKVEVALPEVQFSGMESVAFVGVGDIL